ncbi:MAG: type II toxin-antitoxin system RelE/ParE family toxin [Burkholderiaceae bacterium]
MIKTFAHKGLEVFFSTGSKAGIRAVHAKRLALILAMLDQAGDILDMDAPVLRLHQLKGNMAGMWSVTVQANWRITFQFENGDAHVVNYQDYH